MSSLDAAFREDADDFALFQSAVRFKDSPQCLFARLQWNASAHVRQLVNDRQLVKRVPEENPRPAFLSRFRIPSVRHQQEHDQAVQVTAVVAAQYVSAFFGQVLRPLKFNSVEQPQVRPDQKAGKRFEVQTRERDAGDQQRHDASPEPELPR